MYNLIERVHGKDIGEGIQVLESGRLGIICDAVESHKYMYGFRIALSELGSDSSVNGYFVESDPDVQVCFYYYDLNLNILSKDILKGSQVLKHEFPENCSYIDIYFRVVGEGLKKVDGIVVGDFDKVSEEISSNIRFRADFDGLAEDFGALYGESVFFLETLFCDTETRVYIMDRYFSFLVAQLSLFSKVKGKDVYWFVHFSEDKKDYIDKFLKKISLLGLSDNVFVNQYKHPSEGYSNFGESHIDRLVKPNATYPKLRNGLFELAVNRFFVERSVRFNDDTVFVRGVLDDDDFLDPSLFVTMSQKINQLIRDGENNPFVIVNKNILVSYFGCYGSGVQVDKVRFKRAVCGCRYSVAIGQWPVHPFAIDETVENNVRIAGQDMAVYDLSECEGIKFSYSYNRHSLNLSNARKNFFYDVIYESLRYPSHKDFVDNFSVR